MEREPQIVFRNMPASPALEAVIRERIDRLEQYHSNIIGCRVVAEVPHRSAEGAKPPLALTVEVEVGGRPLIVAKGAESRREAKNDQAAVVTHVFEAVGRQLRETAAVQKGAVKASAPRLASDGSDAS